MRPNLRRRRGMESDSWQRAGFLWCFPQLHLTSEVHLWRPCTGRHRNLSFIY